MYGLRLRILNIKFLFSAGELNLDGLERINPVADGALPPFLDPPKLWHGVIFSPVEVTHVPWYIIPLVLFVLIAIRAIADRPRLLLIPFFCGIYNNCTYNYYSQNYNGIIAKCNHKWYNRQLIFAVFILTIL